MEVADMSIFLPVLRRTGLVGRPERDLFDVMLEGFGLPEVYGVTGDWTPAFDVSETEKDLVVEAEVPGMGKEDVTVTFADGLLTVKGEKKIEKEEKKENYHLTERCFGAFSRTMRLPENVDVEKADATYKNGVLRISLPKTVEKETKIEVKG
jgi:HSP20 family protein